MPNPSYQKEPIFARAPMVTLSECARAPTKNVRGARDFYVHRMAGPIHNLIEPYAAWARMAPLYGHAREPHGLHGRPCTVVRATLITHAWLVLLTSARLRLELGVLNEVCLQLL